MVEVDALPVVHGTARIRAISEVEHAVHGRSQLRIVLAAVLHQLPESFQLVLQVGRRHGPVLRCGRLATDHQVGQLVVTILLGHLGQVHDPAVAQHHAIAGPAFGGDDGVGLDGIDVGDDLRSCGLDLLGLLPGGPVFRCILAGERLEALVLSVHLVVQRELGVLQTVVHGDEAVEDLLGHVHGQERRQHQVHHVDHRLSRRLLTTCHLLSTGILAGSLLIPLPPIRWISCARSWLRACCRTPY